MGLGAFFKALMSPPPQGPEGRADLRFSAGLRGVPLTSALLKQVFEDPECEMILLTVLSKPLEKRSDLEHMFFTTYLMGLVEQGIKGELAGVKERLGEMAGAKAGRGGRSGKAVSKKTGKVARPRRPGGPSDDARTEQHTDTNTA